MKNLEFNFPLVDGSVLPFSFPTGKEMIFNIIGDDIRPPILSLAIEAKAQDGKKVIINIPNDDSELAFIEVEGSK